MMNKKAFTTQDFIIAMLIFSAVIGLLVVVVGSLSSDYDNDNIADEEFAERFDRFDNDTERIGSMWEAVTGEGGLSLVGTVEVIFFSTFRVISLVFLSVVEAGRQLFGFGEYFGLPSAVTGIFFLAIFSALTVLVIFKILSFIKGSTDL